MACLQFNINHTEEVVCMATYGSLVAVGSRNYLTFLDTRSNKLVGEMHCMVNGVRSVVVHEHLLSYGTGHGTVNFHDMRQQMKFAKCKHYVSSWGLLPAWTNQLVLAQDRPRWTGYPDEYCRAPAACYSHAWDPSGTKLWTAGGPLAVGMKGCYLALWQ